MEAKDLRIGNLVYLNNELYHRKLISVPLTVTGVTWKESEHFPNSKHSVSLFDVRTGKEYSQFNEFVSPIKLTEEWLLKFGFGEDEDNLGYWVFWSESSERLYINLNEEDSNRRYGHCFWGYDYHVNSSINYYVQYVHQLQNLYFSLTGEELTIK